MALIYTDLYDLFTGPQDPRTVGWKLTDPWIHVYITSVYLFILYVGPKIMKTRAPYSLKTYIKLYNMLQIIGCSWLFYEYVLSGTLSNLFQCPGTGDPSTETNKRLATAMWFYLVAKLAEYSETIVFILRKKENQVSLLHIYHHITTLFFAWTVLRFRPGGLGGYIQGMNSFVHIVMYTYYLLSVCASPYWLKQIGQMKKYLTMLQMIQFCLMLTTIHQPFHSDVCSNYRPISFLFFPNIVYMLYMFYSFFRKAYGKKAGRLLD